MDRHDHWQTVYRTKDETAVSWFQEQPVLSLDLIGRADPGPEAWIIDIGGGASRLVDALLARGHRHLAVLDIAEAALAKTQARLGAQASAVDWIVADVTAWTPPRAYDLWHDRAVFHFLTEPADQQAYARTLAAAVRPGGQAIIGTFAIDGPERCSGLPVHRYDAAGLAARFAPAFAPIDDRRDDHRTPAGAIQRFQFCRLRRV